MSRPTSSDKQRPTSSEVHPALHPSVTNVPVTPGVTSAKDPFDSGVQSVTEEPEAIQPEDRRSQEQRHGIVRDNPSDSQADMGGTSSAETGNLSNEGSRSLLKRHNKFDDDIDPRTAHSNLRLSGGIISASICLPYDIGLVPDGEWDFKSRRGTSALFDSFSYLASSTTSWKHTLVAWTGEVRLLPPAEKLQKGSGKGISNVLPISKASAPIPVDAKAKSVTALAAEGIRISGPDRAKLQKQLEREHKGNMIPVWLPDDYDEASDTVVLRDQPRWRRYADREIYTLFHYKQNEPADGRAGRKSWADYYKMNKIFADRIIEVYKPGDVVLVHDYYLLLLPSLLRQRIPNIFIGFFLHIPFPSSEFYRCLSRRKELLEGVLGANMVGFQSPSYSRHFSSCCTRILQFDSSPAGVDAYGAHIAVDVFPIGIDAEETYRFAFEDSKVAEKLPSIRDLFKGKKLLIGRDRLDSVRGVYQKLQAFEIFLERYPEWRNKVTLVQISSPSSQKHEQDEDDLKLSNKISDLIDRINGSFGSLGFSPVQHFPQYLSREEYFALLRVADVGLITSVRDGMNTTAFEYVIGQKENHGPLILSEFSGTANSLAGAIKVNPWDLGGVADAINAALTMPQDERAALEEVLYEQVAKNNVRSWTDGFLQRLLENLSSFDQSAATPALDRAKLLHQYRKAKKRLFMFDYDGTLTPIVRDPNAAIPSDKVIRTLKTLASDPANSVWIISGRDSAFLEEWMGHIASLGLSAEHGCFIRPPGATHWSNLAESTDMSWQSKVLSIFQHFTERTQGSFVEQKKVALTWHYRRADPEYGAFQARECRKQLEEGVAKEFEVEVMAGKANLEVRPRFVNKGEIAKKLVTENPGVEFVLCMGDDFTDEDMFRSLRSCPIQQEYIFSVTIGASSKQTLAHWHMLEPADVISAIGLLNGSADAGNVGAVAVVEGHVPETR